MELRIVLFCFVLVSAVFSLCVFVSDVQAIVPEIQEVIFWSNGDDEMVNVTFYHTPVTAFHYVDQVGVDIDGIVSSYDISQSSVTSNVQINLGEISGNPEARVRVHCTVDGWSGWSETQTIEIPGSTPLTPTPSPTPYEEPQQIGQELVLGIVVAVAIVSIVLLVYIIRRK